MNAIAYHVRLLHVLTHIPRQPSGSTSRMDNGFGGGIVDEGGGAAERIITHFTRLVYTHTLPYQDGPLVECLEWALAMEET